MSDVEAWEDDIVRSLKSLTGDEMPSLEILLLDAVVAWVFSDDNPGESYTEEHAGHLISTLFSALDSARGFQATQAPSVTEEIRTARARVVDGAHELANEGAAGVSLAVSRLMPTMLAELTNNAGQRGKQAHGVYVYLLYAVAVGKGTDQHPAVLAGLANTAMAWDGVLREGYQLPWRK